MCGQVECEEVGCGMILVRGEMRVHREGVHGIVDADEDTGKEKKEKECVGESVCISQRFVLSFRINLVS